jgi:hypothetical protein
MTGLVELVMSPAIDDNWDKMALMLGASQMCEFPQPSSPIPQPLLPPLPGPPLRGEGKGSFFWLGEGEQESKLGCSPNAYGDWLLSSLFR